MDNSHSTPTFSSHILFCLILLIHGPFVFYLPVHPFNTSCSLSNQSSPLLKNSFGQFEDMAGNIASPVAQTITSACNAGDPGLIPGLGRSSEERNGNPLQYSCLENPTDGGAWSVTAHVVAKSQTRLSNFTFTWVLRQPFCLSAFLFLGGGLDTCLLYNVTNLHL